MMHLSAILLAAPDQILTIDGLPLHPLVVHVVVVVLPAAVLGLIAVTVRPALRARYDVPVVAALVLGAIAAVLAAKAGEELALVTGISEEHRFWGENLAIGAVLVVVLSAVTRADAALQRSRGRSVLGPSLQRAADALAALLGVALLVMTVLVGHSGAQAVWPSRLAEAQAEPAVSGSPTLAGDALTMAAVAAHADPSSCWTVVDDTVYDVTRWINRHPGGPDVIEALCGIDASAAFTGQHDAQPKPNAMLDSYRIGALATA